MASLAAEPAVEKKAGKMVEVVEPAIAAAAAMEEVTTLHLQSMRMET